MTIRVMIVDPSEITRAGITTTFRQRTDLELVAEAATLDQAIEFARDIPIDVVMIDPQIDQAHSDEAVRRFHCEFPDLRMLVFSGQDCSLLAQSMTSVGASGFMVKASNLDEIAVAIRLIHRGQLFIAHSHNMPAGPKQPVVLDRIAQPVKRTVTDLGSKRTRIDSASGPPIPNSPELSERETEVLMKLADGMTNKQVAEKLFLSVKTVETYRSRVMRKCGLHDRTGLVRLARQLASQTTMEVGEAGNT